MTQKSNQERLSDKTELLQSLHDSLRRVRQRAECLSLDFAAGEASDLPQVTRDLATIEGLIRICQKVEANLVEQLDAIEVVTQAGHGIDLEWARTEIRSRLDRLRTAETADGFSE